MKKLLSYIIALGIFIASCNNNAPQATTTSDSSNVLNSDTSQSTIDEGKHEAKKKPIKEKDALDSIRSLTKAILYDTVYTQYEVADMKELFSPDSINIMSVKFFVALHDTCTAFNAHGRCIKRFKVPQVILQIGKLMGPDGQKTLSYSYYRGSSICPPPTGSCRIQ
jgi:hypothetical protein